MGCPWICPYSFESLGSWAPGPALCLRRAWSLTAPGSMLGLGRWAPASTLYWPPLDLPLGPCRAWVLGPWIHSLLAAPGSAPGPVQGLGPGPLDPPPCILSGGCSPHYTRFDRLCRFCRFQSIDHVVCGDTCLNYRCNRNTFVPHSAASEPGSWGLGSGSPSLQSP